MGDILTREEFEILRLKKAEDLAESGLKREAIDLLCAADKHMWIHQTNWMGEPALQPAEDLFAIQEAIHKSRPDYIIEVGVAWGGSTLFYSCMPGVRKIICIDKFIPPDLKIRLEHKTRCGLHFLEADSTNQETIDRVAGAMEDGTAMVILDSNHTHAHVFDELVLYSQFVKPGHYLIVQDTIIEFYNSHHRNRPWGQGNNPYTAMHQFLQTNTEFSLDKEIDNKLLITCCPGGFLRRSRVST